MSILHPLRSPRRWCVVPVHYSHDPSKMSDWVEEQRSGYLRAEDWDREMELDFTQVSGVRAYSGFKSVVHVNAGLVYNPSLPLRVCIDLNVGIMVWPIVQVVGGKPQVIDELYQSPATIPGMVNELRNRYPNHPSELWIYGDASGAARSTHDQQSDYDLLKLELAGYSAPLVWKVPAANPPVRERINAMARVIKGADGRPDLSVHPRCEQLIADFFEVLLDPRDGKILKTSDAKNPYSLRTHASDALGYLVAREWPVVDETIRTPQTQKYRPLKYGRLLGE